MRVEVYCCRNYAHPLADVNAGYGLECFQVESAFLWFEKVFTKLDVIIPLGYYNTSDIECSNK